MRRYLPLVLLSFFILIIVVVSNIYLSGYARQPVGDATEALTIYTTMPEERIDCLTQEYQRNQRIRVNVVHLSDTELLNQAQSGTLKADLVIAGKGVLAELKKRKLLAPYSSEQTDLIARQFKDRQNMWTGLWYDPLVFAVNKDFLKSINKVPNSWADLVKDNKYRIEITDFLVGNSFANLLYTFVLKEGEGPAFAYFKKLHAKIGHYAKFPVTPVRMAGMGDTDIGIALQSDSLRYVNEGFPLKILYPREGTTFTLIGAGLVKDAEHQNEAKAFIEWLMQDTPQAILEQNHVYLIPTNPDTLMYRYYSMKHIKLFSVKDTLTAAQKQQLLDKWIQTIRFSSK
jgi:iron(III) transport system substrate-binding protein